LALPTRIRKFGLVAATVAFAALTAVAGPASAQVTTGITATPNPVQTESVFSPSTGAYEGDAGVLTVTIAANSTFIAGEPLKFEECNNDPTSQNSCDGLTLQQFNVGGSTQVVPSANGSVTFTMDLWELPTGWTPDTYDSSDLATYNQPGFDPSSTVTCEDATTNGNQNTDAGTAVPCSIWVGNDPSNWTSNSFVVDSIQPLPAPDGQEPPPTTTTSVAPTTTTSVAPTTTTVAPTTTTTGATTTTVVGTTTSVPATTTTTSPTQGQVPESPSVPLLPLAGLGVIGGGFMLFLLRRRRVGL
jgi:hypothetical protein